MFLLTFFLQAFAVRMDQPFEWTSPGSDDLDQPWFPFTIHYDDIPCKQIENLIDEVLTSETLPAIGHLFRIHHQPGTRNSQLPQESKFRQIPGRSELWSIAGYLLPSDASVRSSVSEFYEKLYDHHERNKILFQKRYPNRPLKQILDRPSVRAVDCMEARRWKNKTRWENSKFFLGFIEEMLLNEEFVSDRAKDKGIVTGTGRSIRPVSLGLADDVTDGSTMSQTVGGYNQTNGLSIPRKQFDAIRTNIYNRLVENDIAKLTRLVTQWTILHLPHFDNRYLDASSFAYELFERLNRDGKLEPALTLAQEQIKKLTKIRDEQKIGNPWIESHDHEFNLPEVLQNFSTLLRDWENIRDELVRRMEPEVHLGKRKPGEFNQKNPPLTPTKRV